MDLVDADRLFAGSRLDLHAAVAADRQIQLGNLIVLRVIRVKIVLAVKFTILGDRTVRRKSDCHRIFHHLLVQYRKGSRHTGAHRAGVAVGRSAKGCRAAAENFCLCR